MDSLQDILGARDFTPPDEIAVIKEYVHTKYKSDCSVKLEGDNVIISVPNSALAGTLRLEQQELIKACALEGKRLVIRIGR